VGSVAHLTMNYNSYLNESFTVRALFTSTNLLPLMVLWTVCLAYFFGFFGISFVDKEELTESPSTFGINELPEIRAAEQLQQPRNRVAPLTATPAPPADAPRTIAVPSYPVPSGPLNYSEATDEEILACLHHGVLKDYQLEKSLGDYTRAVDLRRRYYEVIIDKDLSNIPYLHYDYGKVFGANCEIVLGYIPIPVGLIGPLVLNNQPVYIPLATTEGCLVASANRGCKAITSSGGCHAIVLKDAITRAPCVRMPSAMRAAAMKKWVEIRENYKRLEEAFNSTTNFGKLQSIDCTVAGRNIYLRFCCMSGDAMGMNMVSKGCLKAMEVLGSIFPDMQLVAISGNMCCDKKPAAINWILGRGKSIVVECVIPESVVQSVLKSSVKEMIETNQQKNHIGSAMAGSIGGFNAHAANLVTAVYLATGQDPAQNVESSNCITILEYAEDGKSLHVSVTMPSVEVGTVGGGTSLPAQAGCLDICGVRGAARGEGQSAGDNSRQLALIVGGAVLAGELSLIAALAANHLVRSHMEHNRKPNAEAAPTVAVQPRRNASMPELVRSNTVVI